MNFLELCQEVHGICQIDGETVVSVKNQTGMNERVVNWVNRAYSDIQRHRTDWNFRKALASIEVLEGQSKLSNLRNSLEYIDPKSITGVYGTNVTDMHYMDYDSYYKRYESRILKPGRPHVISLDYNYDVNLSALAAEDFTLKFWYTKSIDTLSENTDEPLIRQAHHDSIIWKAAIYYATEEEADSLFAIATNNYREALNRMELDLRPATQFIHMPLA